MSEAELTSEQEDRLQRLRAMLRGTGTASESRFIRGLRQGSQSGVLIGVALHAAERFRQGLPLTDLEQIMFTMLQGVFSEEEIRAHGREYRSAVADLGTLSIVPRSVTSRDPSSGFTVEDFRSRLPAIARELRQFPNASIVDPERLAAGQPIDTPAFQQGVREFGFGATVFSTAPSDEPALEVPGYRAALQLERFHVRRAVGDQWGGKDEIYWTVAASSDKHKAPVYMSQEFGAVKQGDTRTFSADNKIVFDGPAGDHLGLVVAAWEADQSNAAWYDALMAALAQMVDALWLIDIGIGFVPDPLGDLWSLAFEITKILIFLKEQIRNHDDLSCARTIILDRRALVTLHQRREDVWEFDGDGHHALTVKYTGERPVFPAGTLEYRTLGADSTWNAQVTLGWNSASPPALASHRGKLHAMYIRPGDRALMWSVLEDGNWRKPVQVLDFTSDHQPALAVRNNTLYMTFTALDGSQKVSRYAWLTGQWSEPVSIPWVHTNDAPAMATDIDNHLMAGHRTADGKVLYKRTANWEMWGNGTSSQVSDWTAAEEFSLTGPAPWVARRTPDNKIHVGYQTAWGAWANVPLPSGPEGRSAPAITTHNDEVWLAVRDSDNRLRCYHGDADGFTQVPVSAETPTIADMPIPISHNGTLYVMYRR